MDLRSAKKPKLIPFEKQEGREFKLKRVEFSEYSQNFSEKPRRPANMSLVEWKVLGSYALKVSDVTTVRFNFREKIHSPAPGLYLPGSSSRLRLMEVYRNDALVENRGWRVVDIPQREEVCILHKQDGDYRWGVFRIESNGDLTRIAFITYPQNKRVNLTQGEQKTLKKQRE